MRSQIFAIFEAEVSSNLKYRRFLFKFTIYVESSNKFYYYGHVKDHDEWFELRHARRGEAEVGVIVEGKEWVLKVLTFFLKLSALVCWQASHFVY